LLFLKDILFIGLQWVS